MDRRTRDSPELRPRPVRNPQSQSAQESSSSDNEEVEIQNLVPFHEQESLSGELLPITPGGLSPFPQLNLGQSNELALTTQGASAVSNPGDNIISGGDFPNANFGPVTQHHKTTHKARVTQIAKQEIHHHHYGSEESSAAHGEPSTSQGRQERKKSDVLELKGSIKIFKNQKLHETKLIYKGEKTTATNPIPLAVKLMNYSKIALRETESLHSLDSHLNVVKIYESGIFYSDVKFIFVAMELCSPETLYDYVINMGGQSPNPRQAISHSTQIILGLEYIHTRGIAHRDLKPHNILFSTSGGYDLVKISDFGLSKNYYSSHTTTLAGAAGTIGYMAAEIINDEKPIDPTKCDIFSLGIVLVFRLSDGKHPYGEKYYDWTPNIARGRDPNLADIRLPNKKQMNNIKHLISKMLQHSPENRPTAQDLMKEWNEGVGGFVKETSGETPRTRRVQDAPSDQKHREGTGRADRDPGPESGRIFRADMETRIKEVGGGEFPETSMPATEQIQSPLNVRQHQSIKFNREEKSSGSSGMSKAISVQRDIEHPRGYEQPATSRQQITGIFGITAWDVLVHWKDIEQLASDPMVITKLPDSVPGYSVVAGDRCVYLVKDTTCHKYDLDNRQWIRLSSMKYDHGDWPPAAVLNGKLYVCGVGASIYTQPTKKCEVFTGQWSEIPDMKKSRGWNCIVSHGGLLYSIGGYDVKRNLLRSVEIYNPITDTWKIIQPMNVERFDAKAVVYNGKIYVWGGYKDGGWVASFECFDPLTSTWTLSTFDWWKANKPLIPFIFDNKVLSLLRSDVGSDRTIQQVPLNNESERDLIKVELPERWKLYRILAIK